MDAGDLNIFRTVAREGSISKAAKTLNYVQSNVTARIRQLEQQLQVSLFHRTNRGMTLTSAGENLLLYADKILHLLGEAEQAARAGAPPAGPLRLGAIEAGASWFLTPFMAEYQAMYPDVQLSLITGGTHKLAQKVIRHELHGALVYGPMAHLELEYIKLYDDELVLVAGRNMHEANGLPELLHKPMLFFEVGCTHRTQAEAFLKEQGVEAPNITSYGTLDTILNGVSAGLGVTLLPRCSVIRAEERGELATITLPERYRRLEVGVVVSRGEHRAGALGALLRMLSPQQEKKRSEES